MARDPPKTHAGRGRASWRLPGEAFTTSEHTDFPPPSLRGRLPSPQDPAERSQRALPRPLVGAARTAAPWPLGGGFVIADFRRWRFLVLVSGLLLATLGAARPSRAQGLTGQIGGTVLDPEKATVPGATVAVKNTGTQATREGVTDAAGAFTITN